MCQARIRVTPSFPLLLCGKKNNVFKPENSFLDRIYRINKSGFRKRRTPQNDPIGFALIHSPSVLFDSRCSLLRSCLRQSISLWSVVSFDSLRSLHRSCLRQSISRWSVVVSSPGFGLKKKRVPHKHIYLNFQICFRKGVTARTGLGLNGVDFCRNLFMWF